MITQNIIDLYLTWYKDCEIIVENYTCRLHDNLLGNDFYIHGFKFWQWKRAFEYMGTCRKYCL